MTHALAPFGQKRPLVDLSVAIAIVRDAMLNNGQSRTICEFVLESLRAASVDGRPKAGDPAQTGAPLATSAVPAEKQADAQTPDPLNEPQHD